MPYAFDNVNEACGTVLTSTVYSHAPLLTVSVLLVLKLRGESSRCNQPNVLGDKQQCLCPK